MTQEKSVKISIDQLQIGLYIDLELSWTQHPFLFRRFKIKSNSEIAIIRDLGLAQVTVFPERSSVNVDDEEHNKAAEPENNKDTLWEVKQKRINEAAEYRSKRNKQAKEYSERVKQIKNLTNNLRQAPANAMRDAKEVAELMSGAFDQSAEVLINLVNFSDDRFTMHHHTLNVSVLSLSLGRAMGIEGLELRKLCIGALLHDIGKNLVPDKVLMKRTPLTPPEQKLMNTHPLLGGKLARNLPDVPQGVAEIIEQHHEYLDCSGFPKALSGDLIDRLSRIVAVTNAYDNLCNPADPKLALTPKAAMAILYTRYKGKLDTEIVQRFIQSMGVYPPGTVVRLSDDSIGLVTAVHSEELLKPQILLYHEDVPRAEALNIDLREHVDLSIADALKPGDYPRRIYDYLGIRERTAYYFEQL